MKKHGIIYKVENKVNGKCYIGQTTLDFDERYHGDITNHTHNKELKKELKEYGIENFHIIKEYDIAYSQVELDNLERHYIDIFNTMNPERGYNKTYPGDKLCFTRGNLNRTQVENIKLTESIKNRLGNFYFIFPEQIKDKKFILEFLMLCTKMNYKGELKRKINLQSNMLTKQDMRELLSLGKSQFYEVYNYMIENNMIIGEEDRFIVNPNICRRGAIPMEVRENNNVIRVFNDSIKLLYNSINNKDHVKFNNFLMMLPYMHLDFNILCKDPRCELPDIKKQSAKAIEAIASTSKRTVKYLEDLTLQEGSKFLIKKSIQEIKSLKNDVYIINPKFFYGGCELAVFDYIHNLFNTSDVEYGGIVC